MSRHNPPKGIIFDLGDVLFTWSPNTTTTIPAKLLRSILNSTIWQEYECGHIAQDACYHQVSKHFSVSASEVAEAFNQARDSLEPNKTIISFIQELKQTYGVAVKFYAMSNISKEDYAVLSTMIAKWSIFDQVFTSSHYGMRKPDLEFYRHALTEANLACEEAFFVDDKLENVLAAKSLGIDSIVFDHNSAAIRSLNSAFDCAIGRGYKYLYRNAKHFDSVTDSGVVVPDYFARLLILETVQDRNLVDVEWGSKRTWNFFIGEPALIPGGYFPDDLDTTALALVALQPSRDIVTPLLDEMDSYLNADGTFLSYYDRNKPRIDAVVSANVLACFYRFGRGKQFENTLQMVRSVLLHRTYLEGTRYYPSPDCCLYFFGRLLHSSEDAHLETTLGSLLKSRTQERIGQKGNALDLAMRILTCSSLDLECSFDRKTLSEMQCEDGGWKAGWMYRYGSTGVRFGNRGVTTAMAVKAFEFPERLSSPIADAEAESWVVSNEMGRITNGTVNGCELQNNA